MKNMREPCPILIIEDCDSDFKLIELNLEAHGLVASCHRVASVAELNAALDTGRWDVVLSDYRVPQLDFEHCLHVLQARLPEVPVIMVSGAIGEERAVELLKSGLWGFVLKDNLTRLASLIERSLREAAEIRGRKRAEEEMKLRGEELVRLNAELTRSNRAALNLMQDAIAARTLQEQANAALRQEITDRKKTEHQLTLVNFALNHVSEAAYLIDEHGCFAYMNDEAGHMLGYSLDELRRLNIFALDPDFPKERWPVHWQDLKAHNSLVFESHHRAKDGRLIPVEINANFFEFDGQAYNLGLVRDITERKRAEEFHARLATAVEQAAETIIITDTSGTILYANPAFEKTSGFTCAEVLGQNSRILKSGKQDASFYRQMWDTLKRGEVWTSHFINRRKDGTLYEEEATLSPVRDAGGTIINYVAVKRDVTREMQIEAEFRQSQKMEAIGLLAGGVAHDLNNILAAQYMEMDFLAMTEPLSEGAQKSLQQIRADAERSANLVRQLLLFSRRQMMQPRDLNLSSIITPFSRMLQRLIGEHIQLELHPHPVPLWVHADAGMIEQVLLNLAVNARDAMPTGGRLIVATTEVTVTEDSARPQLGVHPGCYACVIVRDTGTGIPPEVLPRIFEPFFTTKGVGKGSGLGLASVDGIVKQHKGWIGVDNRPGEGVTFRICFPALAQAPMELGQTHVPTQGVGGTETILLVEDEMVLSKLSGRLLRQQGYQVLVAANGPEALVLWAKHRGTVALLLTDIVMPKGMSGLELAKQLRLDKPELKVIFISGYSPEFNEGKLDLRDGVNFLQKPFDVRHLLETVRLNLDKE